MDYHTGMGDVMVEEGGTTSAIEGIINTSTTLNQKEEHRGPFLQLEGFTDNRKNVFPRVQLIKIRIQCPNKSKGL